MSTRASWLSRFPRWKTSGLTWQCSGRNWWQTLTTLLYSMLLTYRVESSWWLMSKRLNSNTCTRWKICPLGLHCIKGVWMTASWSSTVNGDTPIQTPGASSATRWSTSTSTNSCCPSSNRGSNSTAMRSTTKPRWWTSRATYCPSTMSLPWTTIPTSVISPSKCCCQTAKSVHLRAYWAKCARQTSWKKTSCRGRLWRASSAWRRSSSKGSRRTPPKFANWWPWYSRTSVSRMTLRCGPGRSRGRQSTPATTAHSAARTQSSTTRGRGCWPSCAGGWKCRTWITRRSISEFSRLNTWWTWPSLLAQQQMTYSSEYLP